MAQIKHKDGCPKSRSPEKRERTFNREGKMMVSQTARCLDCGASTATKAKAVNDD
jgi:predicted Zn-ribbon and HTH transcriptional regulator